MADRWERTVETDNARRPFEVWRMGEYELSENVNLGVDGWVFELERAGKRVGLFPSLRAGKEAAARDRDEHARSVAAAESTDAETTSS